MTDLELQITVLFTAIILIAIRALMISNEKNKEAIETHKKYYKQ